MTKLRILLLALALLAAIPASAQLQVGVVDKCPSSGSAEGEPNYLKALHRGGNSVVVIPDTPDSKLLASEISSVDLVFLTGGEDINPSYFGEQPSVYLGTVNDRRDSFEFRVIEEALKQGKPIIGTCRGLQVLNVYFGGTLWQDIPSQLPSSLDHRSPEGHPIRLVKGTRLQSLLQADSLFVNTSHHQAVKDIAPQFKVSAVSPDGIVEAFESDVLPIAAFQFHPERLAVGDDSLFTRIYLNLKQLAGEVAASPVLCGTGKLNRAFEELPLGSIKAEGWLLEMLKRQRDGITASLDEIYPQVCGERNGWLGGDGDQWERGPYWIDGLLPMAYILDDAALKAKAQRWVEWTLASQTEDGQFGPRKDYPREAGIQRSNSLDWWPRMVVLKILMQYHNATGDERVIQFMDKYFRYQLRTLPEKPLGNWTRWAEFRAADNMIAALWLYNKTGESYLLELCDILHRQGWDFTGMFLESDDLAKLGSIHCVNLAQGLKEPVIYWQVRPEQRFLDAMARCNKQMRLHNGWPVGMYGGDEALHGNNPVQGSELCSAVELMYSMEEMLKVTGMVGMAEHLERVAFNALPAQNSDDFREHQYFQQANQIHVCRGPHNFDIVYNGTASLFGVLCGYPCCLCNLHQAWPKFTQNLWYRSPDGGFAAMMYAPCSFSAKVGDINIGIKEETCYPMEESIRLTISLPKKKIASFPLNLRIPGWSEGAEVLVNGESLAGVKAGEVFRVERSWKNGDKVELRFPMKLRSGTWYENAVSIERGPLVYALKIENIREKVELDPSERKGAYYWQVSPASPWNYALLRRHVDRLEEYFKVETDAAKLKGKWFWNEDGAPVSIKVQAARIPDWTEYNGDTGPLPYSIVRARIYNGTSSHLSKGTEEVTLIPYGCTTLRISEFPVISK